MTNGFWYLIYLNNRSGNISFFDVQIFNMREKCVYFPLNELHHLYHFGIPTGTLKDDWLIMIQPLAIITRLEISIWNYQTKNIPPIRTYFHST